MRRDLLAECGGARSGASGRVDDDKPDAVASRRGDRYAWARVTDSRTGTAFTVTLWRDGRWNVEARTDASRGTVELLSGNVEGDDDD